MILNYILVVKSINENSKAIALQENCKKDSGESLHYCCCIFVGYMLQWAWNDKLLISMRGLLLYTNLVFIWIVTIFVLFKRVVFKSKRSTQITVIQNANDMIKICF